MNTETALSHGEPDQRRTADEDAVPGEGREAIAGHDGEERLDYRPGDDEGHKGADCDQSEVVRGDRVAVLEELQHRRAGRSEERRVGKECVRPCRHGGWT